MQIEKAFTAIVLALTMTSVSGCTDVNPATDPIGYANSRAEAHVASDVTLMFDRKTEKVYHPAGATYAVCGTVEVNQPGLTDHRRERFVIPINDQMDGMATFDGSDEPSFKRDFEDLHSKFCS